MTLRNQNLRTEIEAAVLEWWNTHPNGTETMKLVDFALSQVQVQVHAQIDRDREIIEAWADSEFRRHKIESWTKHGLDVPKAICCDIAAIVRAQKSFDAKRKEILGD